MVQHLVLVVFAAPLLAFARPASVLASGLRRVPSRYRPHAAADLSAIAAATVTITTFVVVHFSGWYDAALQSQWVHDAEHVAFIGSTTWLWSAVLSPGARRGPARVLAAFATITGMSLFAMVLLAVSQPVSDVYRVRLGIDAAIADQRNGASLMWISGMAVTVPLLLVATMRWAASEERRAVMSESHRPDVSTHRGRGDRDPHHGFTTQR